MLSEELFFTSVRGTPEGFVFQFHHMTEMIFSADNTIVLGYIECSNEHRQTIQDNYSTNRYTTSGYTTSRNEVEMLFISGLQRWDVIRMRGRSRIACGNVGEGVGSCMGCGAMGVGMLFITSVSCTTEIKFLSMGNGTLAAVVWMARAVVLHG